MSKRLYNFNRHVLPFFLLATIVLAWSVLLFYVSPEQIVQYLGARNTYVVVFLLATFTGVTVFTSAPFYASVAVFAAGGADPLLLGILGGTGAFISNSVLYFLFFLGRHSLAGRWRNIADRLAAYGQRLPQWLVPAGVFAYAGLAPMPDDILMAALVLIGCPYARFWPFLLAGNVSIIIIIGSIF